MTLDQTYVSYKRMNEAPSIQTSIQTPTPPIFQTATRTLILDTAERLFGEKGVDGTSVRDITREAGVNLGAINYHFGSKDSLIVEVFMRRLEPLNRERLRRLDALEREAGGKPLELEAILCAFFRPIIEHVADDTLSSALSFNRFVQLLSRSFQEPNPELKSLLKQHFEHICTRFDAAIMKTVPEVSPSEVFWRVNFLIGALDRALDLWSRFEWMPIFGFGPHVKIERPTSEELIAQLIAFAAAGIRARTQTAL